MNVGWLLDVHALQLLLLCGSIQHHTARHFSRRLDITALFRKSISGLLLWLLLLLLLLNVNILLLLLLMLLLLLLLWGWWLDVRHWFHVLLLLLDK